jgi:23S rRNA (guanosine2251-2'-O)-methyltransferase
VKRQLESFKKEVKSYCSVEVLELDESQKDKMGVKAPICALVKHDYLEEHDFLEELTAGDEFLLALDQVQDPRNLGAIARTAAFFGCKYILTPKDKSVQMTNASVATSQGAFTKVKLVSVTNLGRTLEDLQGKGFWTIGADMAGRPVESVDLSFEKKILIMGSEGKGIRPGILKRCDQVVSIGSAFNGLESLNVSVAAGILIHQCSLKNKQ